VPEQNLSIGLDIDEKSVKFVKIRQTGSEIALLKYAVREVPSAEDKVKAVSSILKEIFKDEKSDIPVYTNAFGTNVSLKRINIPLMPDSEISEAIRWEAKNIVPFPIENAAIGYLKIGQITEKSVEKLDIMLAVAGEDLIGFFDAVSKESGVKFAGISAVPFSLCSLLAHSKKCDKTKINAVIDIGAEAASINLFKGDILNFTREITVAGDSFTKAMTGLLVADHWQLNLTYEQAEEIKIQHGIPPKDTNEVTENGIPLIHIFEMMAPTLKRLQNEILRSFDYYKEQFREEKVDGIYLTGGSSGLKNLSEYLSSALGIRVETVNPLESIKLDPKSGIKQDEVNKVLSRLSLSIGLAIDKGGKINFRKSKDKPKGGGLNLDGIFKGLKIPFPSIHVPTNAMMPLVMLIVSGSIAYSIYLSNIQGQIKQELASKQAVLTDVKDLVEKRLILEQISKEGSQVKETLYNILQVLPSGVSLSELSYDNSKRIVIMAGEANDTNTVGKMVKDIEASPKFDTTTLIEARKAMAGDVSKIQFRISFHLT
jgi:type IV pilus assembly protein PilM